MLRIQNIIKRNKSGQPPLPSAEGSGLQIGDVHFFKDTLTLIVAGNAPIELTAREASLLEILLGSENKIIKREELLSKVWGDYELVWRPKRRCIHIQAQKIPGTFPESQHR